MSHNNLLYPNMSSGVKNKQTLLAYHANKILFCKFQVWSLILKILLGWVATMSLKQSLYKMLIYFVLFDWMAKEICKEKYILPDMWFHVD